MSGPIRPHGSRFRDALVIINPGACNPSGVALSIADACREMREHENADTNRVRQDPAIRLITNAKLIPEDKFNANTGAGVLFDRADRPRGYGLAAFLYENESETGRLLEIPEQFTDDE